MARIGPRATWAIKAIRLVHRQQCSGAFELDALVAQRFGIGYFGRIHLRISGHRRHCQSSHDATAEDILCFHRRRSLFKLGKSFEQHATSHAESLIQQAVELRPNLVFLCIGYKHSPLLALPRQLVLSMDSPQSRASLHVIKLSSKLNRQPHSKIRSD
jgi:hypothetical protein